MATRLSNLVRRIGTELDMRPVTNLYPLESYDYGHYLEFKNTRYIQGDNTVAAAGATCVNVSRAFTLNSNDTLIIEKPTTASLNIVFSVDGNTATNGCAIIGTVITMVASSVTTSATVAALASASKVQIEFAPGANYSILKYRVDGGSLTTVTGVALPQVNLNTITINGQVNRIRRWLKTQTNNLVDFTQLTL